MKILQKDFRTGKVKVRTEDRDDNWYLSTIIEPGDLVRSKTSRKVNNAADEERSTTSKQTMTVTIRVEKSELSERLKILGTIEDAPESVPKGSHQSLNIEEGTTLVIQKEKWLDFQKDKIEEASKDKKLKIIICVMDRESASFAIVKKYGFEMLADISGDVAKKAYSQDSKGGFYKHISRVLDEYDKKYDLDHIILASPSFWKEYLLKEISDDIRKKIIQATCNSTGASGVTEVMKRDEIRTALSEERAYKEISEVEKLLEEISRQERAAYGYEETERAAEAGAIEKLLITDGFLNKQREEGRYQRLEELMKKADSMNGQVRIISEDHDGGQKLKGLGGIAAILRYRIA